MNRISLPIIFVLLASITFSQKIVTTVVDDPATLFTDDIIMDASGNLFCADYSGDAVFKRTPSGMVTEFVSGLNTPNGLAFNSQGNLYVCDNVGNRIYILNSVGVPLDTIVTGQPSGIIKDIASDTMIFTTYGSQGSLKKLAPDGFVSDFHIGAPLNGPVGLEYSQGNLYVANFTDREIYRVAPDTLVFIAQLPVSGYLGFLGEMDGYLLATAFNGHKIYRIDPNTGDVNIYAGSTFGATDGALDSAKFTTPNGIFATTSGDTIYVSEYNTGNLRMITGFTLGLNSLTAEIKVHIYPNPASDRITISIKDALEIDEIRLVDITGKPLKTINAEAKETVKLDISHLTRGQYLIHFLQEGTFVCSKSILVE